MNNISYDYTGADNYQFVVYKVRPSRYDNNKKVSTVVSSATKNVSTSNDPMKYTLIGRNNVVITNEDGNIPYGAKDVDAFEILKCFKFADKTGNTFNMHDLGNTDLIAKFGGNTVR